jgi:hypothetical protein
LAVRLFLSARFSINEYRPGASFFETIAGANEPTRQRSGISLLAGRGGEFGGQFRHGDVGLLDDLRQKKRPMRLELGVAPAAAWLGLEASTHANGFHEVHHERDRHFEMGRGGVTRMAILDKADNAFTQIKGIGLRHRESPPAGSESPTKPHANPLDSIRESDALALCGRLLRQGKLVTMRSRRRPWPV